MLQPSRAKLLCYHLMFTMSIRIPRLDSKHGGADLARCGLGKVRAWQVQTWQGTDSSRTFSPRQQMMTTTRFRFLLSSAQVPLAFFICSTTRVSARHFRLDLLSDVKVFPDALRQFPPYQNTPKRTWYLHPLLFKLPCMTPDFLSTTQ